MSKKAQTVADDPAVKEARRLLAEVQAEKREAGEAISRLSGKSADDPGRRDLISEAAEARLAGGDLGTLSEWRADSQELREAYARQRIASKAVELQRRRLAEAETAAARLILGAEADRHRQLARQLVERGRALADAAAELRSWRDRMESAGTSPTTMYESAPGWVLNLRPEAPNLGRLDLLLEWGRTVGALTDADFRRATERAAA